MKVITFLNEKGGVGKTTLATILGAGLAMRGLSGLIIDTDGQGDSSKAVGLSESPNCYNFIMRPEQPLSELVTRVPRDFCSKQLYIVQGNDEVRAIPMLRSTEAIQDAILERFRYFKGKLDFVIFDTQPSPTSLHSAIASMTDYVIIPFECEGFSVADMRSAVNNMNKINEKSKAVGLDKARVIGLIPNKFKEQTVLHKQALADVHNLYQSLVWSPVPDSIAIPSHQYLAETVTSANSKHYAAKALQKFINRAYKEMFEVKNELS